MQNTKKVGLDNVRTEFKAVLILILDLLERGETERAVQRIKEILEK